MEDKYAQLSAQIAKVLFGWSWDIRNSICYVDQTFGNARDMWTEWRPYTDNNHAMMVVEKMREDGWSVEIATNDAANNWNVKLHSADFTQVEENHGQSLCHEICRAALKAKSN